MSRYLLVRLALPLAVLSLLATAPRASAQDAQYWSIQYGPVGQLVGGQLIGGVSDLSATFYNPGALSLRNESSYLLSTESVQWEQLSVESDPMVQLLDTSSSRFGAAPSLLAGALPRWLGEDTRLAWSFLTRQKLDARLGQRLTDPLGPAYTISAAESYLDQEISENWAGLSFSRPVGQSVGIGGTWYGVYRGQRTRKELTAQGITTGGAAANVSGVTDVEYTHYRMLVKLGVAWQTEHWNSGVSLTTPSLGVLGSGKAAYTVAISGIDADGDGRIDPPELSTGTRDDLDSDFKSSWAIGAGVSRRVGGTRLYASAEWYAPVARFDVIELPEGAPGASTLTQELKSVLNGGIGFEHVLSSDMSFYGAFHTDYSASEGSARSNVAISDWNLYHVSGGLSFRFRDNRFTLGASWATGSRERPIDTPIPPEDLPQSGLSQDVAIRYSRITVLLGFLFGS